MTEINPKNVKMPQVSMTIPDRHLPIMPDGLQGLDQHIKPANGNVSGPARMDHDVFRHHEMMKNGHPKKVPLNDEEIAQFLETTMTRTDANADGLIDETEFSRQHSRGNFANMLSHFDADSDGQMSADEFYASQIMRMVRMSFPTMQEFQGFLSSQGIAPETVVTKDMADQLRTARLAQFDKDSTSQTS